MCEIFGGMHALRWWECISIIPATTLTAKRSLSLLFITYWVLNKWAWSFCLVNMRVKDASFSDPLTLAFIQMNEQVKVLWEGRGNENDDFSACARETLFTDVLMSCLLMMMIIQALRYVLL